MPAPNICVVLTDRQPASGNFGETFFMKTWFLSVALFASLVSMAQVDTTTPPYQRYPTLPPLQLLLTDSVTQYTKADLPKKKNVLVMLFSPDCEHCQHEAGEIVANAEGFRDIQIVMVSTYPLYRITEFAETYGLSKMENVVMTKDPNYLLISFYAVRSLPFMALYNKKGNLITVGYGNVAIDKILSLFNSQK